jgi:hypothetical protein
MLETRAPARHAIAIPSPVAPRGAREFLGKLAGVERRADLGDVEEAGDGTHLHGRRDGGDEGQGAGPDLVARRHVEHPVAQVQRRGAGGDARHMAEAGGAGDRGLEGQGHRPGGRDPAGSQRVAQGLALSPGQVGWRQVQPGIGFSGEGDDRGFGGQRRWDEWDDVRQQAKRHGRSLYGQQIGDPDPHKSTLREPYCKRRFQPPVKILHISPLE